ncbi:MAG: divalent metal cation transporter, partial [bacterium]
GWAINSAMIIVAAAVFFSHNIPVNDLQQAKDMLVPLVGTWASIIFAMALLLAGLASSVTAGMAGGSIFAGIFRESYDIHDSHSRQGVLITLVGAALALLLLSFFHYNVLNVLIVSQIVLSIQLPWTIFAQLALTSSEKVMGRHVNSKLERAGLFLIAIIVTGLNLMLVWAIIHG